MEQRTEQEELNLYQVGTILATKCGQECTNGIIIEYDGASAKVLTDFGTILYYESAYDIKDTYEVSDNWVAAKSYGYPFPSVEERIQLQIELLQTSLEILTMGKDNVIRKN